MRKFILIIFAMLLPLLGAEAFTPEFSTAGFFKLKDAGREVWSMNPSWKRYKGDLADAQLPDFDDSGWSMTFLPDGIEYVPAEASGCINYQGPVWYRKHFNVPEGTEGQKLFLHFEGVMGKCTVYLNGNLLGEHFGSYLPFSFDISEQVSRTGENVIAVRADNSDDPDFPPGKPQDVLDFTYFGGIYRDCWLISHNKIHITDANYAEETAGGGVFVHYEKVSEASAEVDVKVQIKNETGKRFNGKLLLSLYDKNGKEVCKATRKLSTSAGKAVHQMTSLHVIQPELWTPSSPNLYHLVIKICDQKGKVIDGYRKRIGIRSLEFRGNEGFWLNGKHYDKPLIGANRHQDFAIIGHALPNSIHWRDAKKLKDVGMEVIRNAHCPQDPAFMDACDELGLLVIVNTPGWQFWNDKPIFEQRVYEDIRNMVRRDRNHPCVWMWEPILNETWYPADFAQNTDRIVHEEYPYEGCYTACDSQAHGAEHFKIHFTHPLKPEEVKPGITYFTREWGDNVDNWNSHNSPSRVARNWGEQPMLVQADHYADPYYEYTCYDMLYSMPSYHIGGCLWHSFDHQRGYHPDPFYGGLMDVYRQPKYSYYMFMAQRPAEKNSQLADNGPMVFIANEMTPFSSHDVTVYSNCEEVRLTINKGGKVMTYKKEPEKKGMPSPIIYFKNAFDVMADKRLNAEGHEEDSWLLAEGIIDGKVVARHKVTPARRPEKIQLRLDDENVQLTADGSDIVTVIAEVVDKYGAVKHLNNYTIAFSIEGEGKIVGDAAVMANPVPVRWGSAPVLIRSSRNAGKIKVRARVLFEGSQMPLEGEIEFCSKAAEMPMIFTDDAADTANADSMPAVPEKETRTPKEYEQEIKKLRKELNAYRLKEVEKDQKDFGEKRK